MAEESPVSYEQLALLEAEFDDVDVEISKLPMFERFAWRQDANPVTSAKAV